MIFVGHFWLLLLVVLPLDVHPNSFIQTMIEVTEQFLDGTRNPRHFHLPRILPAWMLNSPITTDLILPIRHLSTWEQLQEELIEESNVYKLPGIYQLPTPQEQVYPAPIEQGAPPPENSPPSANKPSSPTKQTSNQSGNNNGAQGLPPDGPMTIQRSRRDWVEAEINEHPFSVDITNNPDAQCPICLQFKQQPEQYCRKGHSQCHDCAQRLRSQNEACSICRHKPHRNGETDERLKRQFYALTTVCNLCQWQGDFWSAETHQRQCQLQLWRCRRSGCQYSGHHRHEYDHRDGCPLTQITCWRCNQTVALASLRQHMADACAARAVNVQLEGAENTLQQLARIGQNPTAEVIEANMSTVVELLRQLCLSHAEYVDPMVIVLPQIIPCHNQGCAFHGTQEQLDLHNQQCTMVVCEFCHDPVLATNRHQHLRSSCELVLVNCGNEGCDVSVERRHYPTHIRLCDYGEVTCSFCRRNYLRGEQSQHQQQCTERQHAVMITNQGETTSLSMMVFGNVVLPGTLERTTHRIGEQILTRESNGFYRSPDEPDWSYWSVSMEDYHALHQPVAPTNNPETVGEVTGMLQGIDFYAAPVAESTMKENSHTLSSPCISGNMHLELVAGQDTATLNLVGSESAQQVSLRIFSSGEQGELMHEQWYVPLTAGSSGTRLELSIQLHHLFMDHRYQGAPLLIGVYFH